MARLPSKVKIHLTGMGRGTVSIDGIDIPCVTRITFRACSDRHEREPNRLELELYCGEVEIEGPAEVVMGFKDSLPTTVKPRPEPTTVPSSGKPRSSP